MEKHLAYRSSIGFNDQFLSLSFAHWVGLFVNDLILGVFIPPAAKNSQRSKVIRARTLLHY